MDLNKVYRKDVDEKGKRHYQLRARFTCESCGKQTERQVLYIYKKVQREDTPYVLCDSCLHQRSAYRNREVANNRWKKTGVMYLVDKLENLNEHWNFEKNILDLEEILLKDVNRKEGRYHNTTVHLYCYICKGECERSLRTLLNNKYNTGSSWVLCDDCKSRSRTSKSEILCLLISEYCSKKFGLTFEFQHERQDLLSNAGNPLAFDFAFFKSRENVSFILEIQGGLHYEKHFAESDEDFQERLERDVIKKEYCQKHNLKLVEVDYFSPNKKELRRIQTVFTQLLTDQGLVPADVYIPDFSEFAFHITLEYQKLNSNTITLNKLVTYVMEGQRIGDLTDIPLIRNIFLSDKKTKTAYNRAILHEVIYLLKDTDYSIEEITKITKMSESAIRRVNNGEIYSEYTHASREEPLRKLRRARIDERTIFGIVKDLKETSLNLLEIGKKREVSESVVKAINDGKRYNEYSGISSGHHIRSPLRIKKQQILVIVELLRSTNWTQKKIAEYSGVTKAIVQKINTGYNHSNITGASNQNPLRRRNKK